MKKTKLLLSLIMVSTLLISCKKEINEILEADYKVIDFHYGYDNYSKNIRDSKSAPLIIRERNIVEMTIDAEGDCIIEGKSIPLDSLTSELKLFLIPNTENPKLPENIEKEFTYAGKARMNHKLVLVALIDENLKYKKYEEFRNKIYIANNQLRNDFALEKYGKELSKLMVPENDVEREQFNELIEIFPFNYFEIIQE